jgi:trimeric autotransporter adhesin
VYYAACVNIDCKSPASKVEVIVLPTPSEPFEISASPSSICSGESSTLSAICAAGTLTWYSDEILKTELTSTTVSPLNTTVYYAICVSGDCKSPTSKIEVIVTPTPLAPTAAAASPATICAGQSSTLSATCATGTLSWFSDAALTTPLASTTVSPSTTTTYYSSCVNGVCKSPSSPVTVTVVPLPGPPTGQTATPTPICEGESTALTASCATGTLTWYSDAGLTALLPSTTVSPTSTTTYYAACVSGTCKSTAVSVQVLVRPTPVAPTSVVASPASICAGSSSVLSGSCATGVLTLYSDVALTTILTSSTVSPSTTTTYYAACVLALGGCKSPATPVTVTVTPVPAAPTGATGSPTAICSGESSILTANCATGSLTWYSDAGLTTVLPSTTVSPTANTTYYASCVNGTCKSPSSSVNITVTQTPTAPTSAAASPASICAGASSTLSATCATGTLTWYSDAALTTTLSSTTVSPAATTTYYAACVSGACKSPSSNVTVTVTPIPLAPTSASASPTAICSGESSTLSATCATGTLTWYSNAGLTTVLPSTTVSPTVNTTYYASCVSETCKSPASLVTVTVTTTPSAPTGAMASPAAICSGQSTTLSANCTSGVAKWYSDAALTLPLSSNTQTPAANTSYYVSCVDGTCKSPSASVSVVVTATPTSATVTRPAAICVGESKDLSTAATCSSGTPTWYSDAALSALLASTTVSPTTTTTYYVACVNGICKSPATSVILSVNPSPSAPTITPTATTICGGSPATLTASGCGGTINWYVQGSSTSLATTATYSANPAATTTYEATCTVGLCVSSRSQSTVTVVTPPASPSISVNDENICLGGTITLNGINCVGTLEWFKNGSATSFATGVSITDSPTSTTTYVASCNGAGAVVCISGLSVPITVTVNEIPAAPVVSSTTPAICTGSTSTLNATSCVAGSNVAWSDGQTGASITVSPTVTTSYTAKCVNAITGCESPLSNSLTITVTTTPSSAPTAATSNPSGICSGQSTTLSSSCASGTAKWYSDAALTTELTSLTVSPTTTTTYYTACVNGLCKGPSSQTTVTVTATPLAPTTSTAIQNICSGQSATLSASCASGTVQYFSDAALTVSQVSTVSPTTSTTYYATCANGLCKSPALTLQVNVTSV